VQAAYKPGTSTWNTDDPDQQPWLKHRKKKGRTGDGVIAEAATGATQPLPFQSSAKLVQRQMTTGDDSSKSPWITSASSAGGLQRSSALFVQKGRRQNLIGVVIRFKYGKRSRNFCSTPEGGQTSAIFVIQSSRSVRRPVKQGVRRSDRWSDRWCIKLTSIDFSSSLCHLPPAQRGRNSPERSVEVGPFLTRRRKLQQCFQAS
jgi:hypothetical protein